MKIHSSRVLRGWLCPLAPIFAALLMLFACNAAPLSGGSESGSSESGSSESGSSESGSSESADFQAHAEVGSEPAARGGGMGGGKDLGKEHQHLIFAYGPEGITLVESRRIPLPLPKSRLPSTGPWRVVVETRDGEILYESRIAAGDLIRAEFAEPGGKIEGSVLFKQEGSFALRLPLHSEAAQIRLFAPRPNAPSDPFEPLDPSDPLKPLDPLAPTIPAEPLPPPPLDPAHPPAPLGSPPESKANAGQKQGQTGPAQAQEVEIGAFDGEVVRP